MCWKIEKYMSFLKMMNFVRQQFQYTVFVLGIFQKYLSSLQPMGNEDVLSIYKETVNIKNG